MDELVNGLVNVSNEPLIINGLFAYMNEPSLRKQVSNLLEAK